MHRPQERPRQRRKVGTGSRAAGFTLLEVMIALGVFAIVATAITASTAGALSQTERLRDRTQASLVLDSHLATVRLAQSLPLGSVETEQQAFGRQWRVRQQTETPQSETWGSTLRRITVEVSIAGRETVLARRVTLEPVP